MNIQTINLIQNFLGRTQIQGAEAPALMQCMQALEQLKAGITNAQQAAANRPAPVPTHPAPSTQTPPSPDAAPAPAPPGPLL